MLLRTLLKALLSTVFLLSLFVSTAQAEEFIVRFKKTQGRPDHLRILKEQNLQVVDQIDELDMYVVNSESRNPSLDFLRQSEDVMYVDQNHTLTLTDTTPNDKKFSNQWHHKKIKTPQAWDITKGSQQVVVAVIDTGMSLTHEDLKNQLWFNTKEVAQNGVDDDRNGFIDDTVGWDFANNDNNPTDDQSHGSHCAGLIGAEGNNQTGVTGVNWKVKIMPLKFITSSGSGSETNAIKAILYAANNGAQIISASWGSPEFVQALSDAIQYAANKNVLFVAAAGNDKTNVEKKGFYPAGLKLPNVISVAASSSSNARADFTNYGKSAVHVAAPGVDIYSTSMGNSYETKSGTSMATPIVSGVAALIRSLQPNLNVTDLRNAVLNATVNVGSWKNYVATDGLIQADLAVGQLSGGPQIWPKKLRVKAGDTVQFTAFKSTRAVWSSNAAAIAQVSPQGSVKALAVGSALISFVDDAGQSHSANLEVVAK